MTGQDDHPDSTLPPSPPALEEEAGRGGGGAADLVDGDDEEVDRKVKRFLCHKEVLDTLRLYLEPTERTINRLLKAGVVSMAQRDNILSLRWPMSRNELMQSLVRRSWDGDSFTGFLEVVKHTQNPRLAQTLGVLLKKDRPEVEEQEEQFDHPLKDLLKVEATESVLQRLQNAAIDAKTKSMIQKMLRLREEEVTRARADLEALRTKVGQLETANVFLQGQMAALETAVADVVADVVEEGIYPNTHDGLRAVWREVKKLVATVQENQTTISQLEAEKKRWTHANSLLTTQNIHMREDRLQLKKRLEDLSKRTSAEIVSLKIDLKNEKAAGLNLYGQLTLAKNEHEETAGELATTSTALERTERALEAASRSRDVTLAELKAVDQRVRKLLKILGMADDRRQLSQAVEHAGNLLLVRRRRDRQLDRRGFSSRGRDELEEEDESDAVFFKEPNHTTLQRAAVSNSISQTPDSEPKKFNTMELQIPSATNHPPVSRRRTSMLGLPRALNVLTTGDGTTRRDSVIHLSPHTTVSHSQGDSLPHIRRRASMAQKLKTDLQHHSQQGQQLREYNQEDQESDRIITTPESDRKQHHPSTRSESVIRLSINPQVAQSDTAVLPHIRRRSSMTWKLKTDLQHVHNVPQDGQQREEVGTNHRVRKTSTYMKPLESTLTPS